MNKDLFVAAFIGAAVYEAVGIYTDVWPTITEAVAAHPVIGFAAWAAVVVGGTVHFVATILERRRAK